jgi:hypothetical protein
MVTPGVHEQLDAMPQTGEYVRKNGCGLLTNVPFEVVDGKRPVREDVSFQ